MENSLNPFEPVFTIGTVAKMLNIAVQTIRLYEQEGLILPAKTETARRMFSLHDVDRLKCIRKLLKHDGLNISGIKKMMSLLPCWEFKGGLDDECKLCPAYYETIGPCWHLKEVGEKCKGQDCRGCKVYQMNVSCEEMKTILYRNRRPEK
jgi:MerR family transcriptional regulator/heat shock protein HspR